MFKRKEKIKTPTTMQEAQNDFNTVVFELGDLNYRKHMVKTELTRVEEEIHKRTQRLDTLGKIAQTLRDKAKAEVVNTIKKGQSDAQETPKAG